jgi:single-strand DNA-binding protein
MANFNKVILLGNLTRDIELRYSQSGLPIAKLGMAINRRFSGQDGEQKETTCFVDLTAFGKQAEVLNQYVGKGSPLFVEGRLEYSTWDGQDGQKHSKLAVVIENFQFVGAPRGEGGGAGGPRARPSRPAKESPAAEGGGSTNVDYGDIPF